MNKKYIILSFLLAIVFLICCTCEVNDPICDLKFNPIHWNDNLIFLCDTTESDDKIYCIDTSADLKIYTYNLTPYDVNMFIYDENVSREIYMNINYNKKLYVLHYETGKVSGYSLQYPYLDLAVLGKKIMLVRNKVSFKGRSDEYELYNPKTNEIETCINKDGGFTTHIDMNMEFDDKIYIPLGYDNGGDVGNTNPTVLNITDNKILEFYPEKKYLFFHFVGQGYLFAYNYDADDALISDVYKVNSFEPVDAQVIYSNTVVARTDQTTGLRIFEDDDYLYVIDQPTNCQRITKRNKSDYSIVKQKVITTNYEGGTVPYYKNDHFWVVSREDEGAYKISKDLEITVVK